MVASCSCLLKQTIERLQPQQSSGSHCYASAGTKSGPKRGSLCGIALLSLPTLDYPLQPCAAHSARQTGVCSRSRQLQSYVHALASRLHCNLSAGCRMFGSLSLHLLDSNTSLLRFPRVEIAADNYFKVVLAIGIHKNRHHVWYASEKLFQHIPINRGV